MVRRIIKSHSNQNAEKKSEFINYLIINNEKCNLNLKCLQLIDSASSSSLTKESSETTTIELPYQGMFLKYFVIGSLFGILLSFLVAFINDFLNKLKNH